LLKFCPLRDVGVCAVVTAAVSLVLRESEVDRAHPDVEANKGSLELVEVPLFYFFFIIL
jgi:hypothetical protein